MSAPPASTVETTGATPRSAAAAPTASAASFAPSWVRAGTSAVEKSAAAPAMETDSSSSGVSPLVPIAPTTSSPMFSGIPPVRQEAPWSASAPSRPFVTCSSISRLAGRGEDVDACGRREVEPAGAVDLDPVGMLTRRGGDGPTAAQASAVVAAEGEQLVRGAVVADVEDTLVG